MPTTFFELSNLQKNGKYQLCVCQNTVYCFLAPFRWIWRKFSVFLKRNDGTECLYVSTRELDPGEPTLTIWATFESSTFCTGSDSLRTVAVRRNQRNTFGPFPEFLNYKVGYTLIFSWATFSITRNTLIVAQRTFRRKMMVDWDRWTATCKFNCRYLF